MCIRVQEVPTFRFLFLIEFNAIAADPSECVCVHVCMYVHGVCKLYNAITPLGSLR